MGAPCQYCYGQSRGGKRVNSTECHSLQEDVGRYTHIYSDSHEKKDVTIEVLATDGDGCGRGPGSNMLARRTGWEQKQKSKRGEDMAPLSDLRMYPTGTQKPAWGSKVGYGKLTEERGRNGEWNKSGRQKGAVHQSF